MSTGRPLTLDRYLDPPSSSIAPRFQEVIEAVREAHSEAFLEMRRIALRLAAESGKDGFSADTLRAACDGFRGTPRCLPGVVPGHLRSKHALCVVGRIKGTSPKGKSRWINVFALNSEAIEVDE